MLKCQTLHELAIGKSRWGSTLPAFEQFGAMYIHNHEPTSVRIYYLQIILLSEVKITKLIYTVLIFYSVCFPLIILLQKLCF